MAIISKDDAQTILKKVLGFSTADECEATLTGSLAGNVRSARNAISTSGITDNVSLVVQSRFGKRSGIATCNQFDEATLRRCVQRAEEIARLAPESPEYVPLLGAQTYLAAPQSFAPATAAIDPDYRARQMATSMQYCDTKKLSSAGFLNDSAGFVAKRNSKGLEAYQQVTNVAFSITVRTPDGMGSGYAATDYVDASRLDAARLTKVAADKAAASVGAKAIEPGKYTVILEPNALLSGVDTSLLGALMQSFDARSADEGRSFLSKKGGGNRRGEKLFDERVTSTPTRSTPKLPTSRLPPMAARSSAPPGLRKALLKTFTLRASGPKNLAFPTCLSPTASLWKAAPRPPLTSLRARPKAFWSRACGTSGPLIRKRCFTRA